MFGIYSGLRISDILPLRVRDVRNKEYIYLREKKTGKETRFPINDELKAILKWYIKDKKDYDLLFPKMRGRGAQKPVGRQRVWKILNDAARQFGYTDKIGCHTMRKTFGYLLYKQTHDIVALQEIFNHSDASITKRYIGINQDSKDKIMRGLTLKR